MQSVGLLFCFYTFSEHNETKVTRHGNCGGNDGFHVGALQQISNKRHIDLELVGGKSFEVWQIEAGARKSRFRDVDLVQIMSTVSEIYTDVAEDASLRLIDRIDTSRELLVHGDRELLIQMFVNLVENAIRHCPPGTEITLEIHRRDDLIMASVADNGPGIPEDEREKVFRRLYRLDKSRTTVGSGLGLSLVRAIADLHCGTVALKDNRPGLLSEITLPSV
ncbi:hypothetical protein AX761_24255 [Rhizobium sp. 58]|nr:hypothetical protein AX761_24255 [Rhizobium sp. 58]